MSPDRRLDAPELTRKRIRGPVGTHATHMLILGSDPAGLGAASYRARAGMEPIVVQGLQRSGGEQTAR